MVIDPRAYTWSDAAWRGRPFEEAVLYEVHLGTATTAGTYAALSLRLDELAELGVTAIELMPIGDFPGRRNWGYDGVLPFAPDASYGTPDELKRLIDRAHALRLMVFIDVVYNHFGPFGNHLPKYAGAFLTKRHLTPWGEAINFDGDGSRHVRDFFIQNALYWLEEFHADGLRMDAVHAIRDDGRTHFLAEVATRVRRRFPERDVHLVLENDANEARWLARDTLGRPRFHTAQWNDDFHHIWHGLLTGETEGLLRRLRRRARGPPRPNACRRLRLSGRGLRASRRKAARRALRPSAAIGLRGLPAEPRSDRQSRLRRAPLASRRADEARARARRLAAVAADPLLFMGRRAASSPFLFFADFSDDAPLAAAVREGRRREFARFSAFENPRAAKIPGSDR